MAMEEKFKAAVDVIKSIPFDGTFEPSNEMMLRLYALENQANEGPCNIPKPYVWNVSARAQWNAWNELGDMTSDLAMQGYIEELSKVIETMSYNDKISKFMSLVGPFYEVVSTEDADSQSLPEKNSDASCPANVLDNYDPPTISELYHMSKNTDDKKQTEKDVPGNLMFGTMTSSVSSSCSDSSNHDKNWSLQSGQSQLSQSFHYSQKVPTYSESSSSSSTDISNFDVLSDLSDVESFNQNAAKVLRTRKIRKNCPLLTKKDLLFLTLMNVQTTMEDVLKKLDHLNVLAESSIFEESTEKTPADDWNLNITGTAISLIWPILVQLYFEYLKG